jgi:hypothetical protein
MFDVAAITGTVESIKAVIDLTQTLINARDAAAVKPQILELQGQVVTAHERALAAQLAQTSLLKRVNELEAKVAELEKWNAEKEHYQLIEIRPSSGIHALCLKGATVSPGQGHYFCQKCYEERHLSVLQKERREPGRCEVFACPRCGTDLYTIGYRKAEHIGFRPK